ncbi:hypothetical protein GWC95_00435 [Sediminibacterium roseum]|uniref:Dolichyl-phosphate-mannose-protein mannosyltransferase n=1 Tax=Sediminibacterium roseum TaxID=1978412 RepID=A0ABW9ZU30_9BACT|nr:hypothetical protein [Sediminibacterium roseum]NCI48366.1 hypothetical protein [Sediminibacterium roseum]
MKKNLSLFLSKHWDALLASIAACTFICLFTRVSGIGISPDSVNYMSAATNIRDHFSFTDFNGKPLVDFPLGYPCFLALASLISGSAVLQIAPLVNCILISGVIILTSLIIESYKPTAKLYKTAFLSLVACSPCLLEIYAMLWSETFFLFLSLLFIVLLKNYCRSYRTGALFAVAIVAALGFVTRYAGITLLATGFYILVFNGELPTAKKIKHLLLFTLTGVSLVVINLLRNKQAAGHSTGVREKALRTVGDNLEQAGNVLSEWLPFLNGHASLSTCIFIFLLLMGVAFLVYRLLQQQYFAFTENIVACYFVVYAVFIIAIASISRFEDLSGRLLSPLYIPMLLTATGWIIGFMKRSVRTKRILTAGVCLLILYSFHSHHYKTNAAAWEGIKDSGMPGYAEGSWRESPAVAMVRANKANLVQPLYANANDAAYFMAGIHAMPLPHKEIQAEIDALFRHPSFTVIWFVDGDNPDLVSLDFIKQHRQLLSVVEVENGGIYVFGGTK